MLGLSLESLQEKEKYDRTENNGNNNCVCQRLSHEENEMAKNCNGRQSVSLIKRPTQQLAELQYDFNSLDYEQQPFESPVENTKQVQNDVVIVPQEYIPENIPVLSKKQAILDRIRSICKDSQQQQNSPQLRKQLKTDNNTPQIVINQNNVNPKQGNEEEEEEAEENNNENYELSNGSISEKNSISSDPSVSSCDSLISSSAASITLDDMYIVDGETEWNDSESLKLQQACGTLPVLIVDLDNTLVHSDVGEISQLESMQDGEGNSVGLIDAGKEGKLKLLVKIRPFLKEFLITAFNQFNVVMYTLGSITYARAVHELFKSMLPDVFSQGDFLRIIAQPSPKPPTNNVCSIVSDTSQIIYQQLQKKNVSRYFELAKYTSRLLILDDNRTVYEHEWMDHVIFTKPYRFWNEEKHGGSDSFLLFTASLLQYLTSPTCLTTLAVQSDSSLAYLYARYKASIFQNQVLYFCPLNPNANQIAQIAKDLGAKIFKPAAKENSNQITNNNIIQNSSLVNQQHSPEEQTTQLLPLKVVISGDNQYYNEVLFKLARQKNLTIITDNWIKCCYILNCRVPTELFEVVPPLTQPNNVPLEYAELELSKWFMFQQPKE